ncbi:GNAT family protein, partial [Alcanivorax sp.]|uniref:GNAT family N-acetyltransferase n=1 Tax=Alcanivorax sp. TaxID=1872427 RepID=UPI0019C2E6AA
SLLKMGFDDFDLNKIEIRCAVDNHRSRAIAERLGFTHEATLSQSEWLYTGYVDQALYSLLATEYRG